MNISDTACYSCRDASCKGVCVCVADPKNPVPVIERLAANFCPFDKFRAREREKQLEAQGYDPKQHFHDGGCNC